MSFADRSVIKPSKSTKSLLTNKSPFNGPSSNGVKIIVDGENKINEERNLFKQVSNDNGEIAHTEKLAQTPYGYELVKPPKCHKLSKQERDDSGYLFPKATKGSPSGYALIKVSSPSSKKIKKESDSQSEAKGEYIHNVDKRRKIRIIAIIILTIAFLTLFIVVIYLVTVTIQKAPLPNLTELCRNIQPVNPKIDRNCYIHLNKYPDNCYRTNCNTIALTFEEKSSSFKEADTNDLTSIPDETPCGPTKWCIGGLCVETRDKRIAEYDEEKSIDGSWRNDCEKPTCLQTTKFISIQTCNLENDCGGESKKYRNPFRFAFRSCNQPLPKHGGKLCWSKNEDIVPLEVIKDCGPCPDREESKKSYDKCKKSDTFSKCKVNNQEGYCLRTICVPNYEATCSKKSATVRNK